MNYLALFSKITKLYLTFTKIDAIIYQVKNINEEMLK